MKQEDQSQRNSLRGSLALWVFCSIPLLHLAGYFFENYLTWSFNQWAIVPLSFALPLLGLAVFAATPPIADKIGSIFSDTIRIIADHLRRVPKVAMVAGVSILLIVVLFLLRSKTLLYGDSYTVLSFITASSAPPASQYLLQALSVYGLRLAVELTMALFPVGDRTAFALVNILGGVVGLWALIFIVKDVTHKLRERIVFGLAILSSGSLLLFFGHIETYTWVLAVCLWLMYHLLKHLRGKNRSIWLIILSIIAAGLHFVAIPTILAVAALVVVQRYARSGIKHISIPKLGGGLFLVSIAIMAVDQALGVSKAAGLGAIFVTVWPMEQNHYWFLHYDHLVDFANLVFFHAPLVLVLIFCRPGSQSDDRPFSLFQRTVGIVALFNLVAAFWVDPLLSMARDWDLLSLFGFPLVLYLGALIVSSRPFARHAMAIIGAILIIVLVHTGGAVYELNRPVRSLTRLNKIIDDDPHYQANYLNGYRLVSWAGMMSDFERDDLAKKYYARRLQGEHNCVTSWFNLGIIYDDAGQLDSAAYCYRNAAQRMPGSAEHWLRLADVEGRRGIADSARWALNKAIQLDPNNANAYTIGGYLFYHENRFQDAVEQFQDAVRLAPESYRTQFDLGWIYAGTKKYDSAYVHLTKAFAINPKELNLHRPLIITLLALGQTDKARRVYSHYKSIDPDLPDFGYFQQMLDRL